MELTGKQLDQLENRLNEFRPQSQQVYGYLVMRNRVRSDPIKVIVDHWPEFNVVVCQPIYELEGDQFKDTCFFATNEATLIEILRNANFNWTKDLCFGGDLCHEDTMKALASMKNMSGNKMAVCHMMTLENISNLPPVNSSDISISSLEESHICLVNRTWKFGQKEDSIRMIRNMITNFPSCCVLDADSQPVAWILTYASCAMGMLYTLPEHRGKGYAKALVSCMAKKLHVLGYPVYCYIEEENTVSYMLFKSLGFTEDPSYRAAWFVLKST